MGSTYTHRDIFRIAHPRGVDPAVGNFILKGEVSEDAPEILKGFEKMQRAGSAKEVISTLNEHKNLPWETIPTQFLNEAKVWQTLFYNGALGQTALIRNISRLDKIGAFKSAKFAGDVAKALRDGDRIAKGRVHPIQYANARGMYGNLVNTSGYGWGYRNVTKNTSANAKVLGALEDGFYNSFANIEPANVASLVAVDVSSSMTWDAPAGVKGLNALEAAALMAMVTVRSEPYAEIVAFSTDLQRVGVSDTDSFESVLRKFSNVRMGGTDVAAPMVWAKKNKLEFDAFSVYTDNETWAGRVKPNDALKQYNAAMGRNARLAVVGMTATEFTVADPTMPDLMLDVVGFDSTAPSVMANFFAGR